KYPVLYTILVWIGIAAFGLVMLCGMYILSFVPETPASDGEERQMLIENGAAIVALGATSLIYLGLSLWRNRAAYSHPWRCGLLAPILLGLPLHGRYSRRRSLGPLLGFQRCVS